MRTILVQGAHYILGHLEQIVIYGVGVVIRSWRNEWPKTVFKEPWKEAQAPTNGHFEIANARFDSRLVL